MVSVNTGNTRKSGANQYKDKTIQNVTGYTTNIQKLSTLYILTKTNQNVSWKKEFINVSN